MAQNRRFLFCENLNRTISKRYLLKCKEFFSKHDLAVKIIDSVYTNGASAMLVVLVLLNQDTPHLQGSHCFLNLHALISKTLP